MNPDTNQFEELFPFSDEEKQNRFEKFHDLYKQLYRADGTPVPKTWSIFTEGEYVVLKDYTFKVVRIGESYLVLEPVKPEESINELQRKRP